MLCAFATLVGVPVLLSAGASSDGEDVAAVVVPETVTASELAADVDIDGLFDAGADFEDVPDVPVSDGAIDRLGDAAAVAGVSSTLPEPTTSSTISAAPETAAPETTAPPTTAPPTTAPTTAAPTTAAPTTAAPTTAPPTTAAPTTAAPTTEAPPTEAPAAADEAAGVATEAPQAAEEAPAPLTPTPEQWAALRHCESSGNYSVVSSNGLYHGAYQFYQPTWDGLARQLGRTDLVGLPPSQAAPADQDALALLLWQQRGSQPWPHCGRYLPAGP